MSTKENADYICMDIEDFNKLVNIKKRLFLSDTIPFKVDEVRDLANLMDTILADNNIQFMEVNDTL